LHHRAIVARVQSGYLLKPTRVCEQTFSRVSFLRQGTPSVKRFTLYGSPHSLPTYKVALMLRLSGEPFSFRYVSFQKGMYKTPEF